MAALLFLLLVFTTVTVWIGETWALQSFQIGIYGLVIVQVLAGFRNDREQIAVRFGPLLVYLIPVWGIIQLAARTTTSSFETREEVLRWGALSGVFYLSQSAIRSQTQRQKFLIAIMCFATGDGRPLFNATQYFTRSHIVGHFNSICGRDLRDLPE